jgi:hypothetical protein
LVFGEVGGVENDRFYRGRRPLLPGFKAGKYVRFERGTVRLAVAKWQKEREGS